MREIKFRAWDKTKKQMIPWEKLCDEDKNYNGDDDSERLADYLNNEFSNIEPLMQFTGLLDKNGKEIYEGDIVQTFDTLQVSAENRKQCVHWSNYAAAFVPFGFHAYAVRQAYNDKKEVTADCEVIGNIYEHPELLEAK